MADVTHVWVIEAPPDGYGLGTAFDSEEEAQKEAECWGGGDVLGPFVHAFTSVRAPLWLVKNDDGKYVAEVVPGCVYFTEHQRNAKRFTDQGKAYRLAMKWGLDAVVRLVRRPTDAQREKP